MKVSIAMATYNGARWIEEQLDSFAQQDRRPDELVVCDDCSGDETISIIEQFRRRASFEVRVVSNEKNSGHIRSFLRAMSLCRGDVIFLSDQDDTWRRTKISTMIRLIEENPRRHVFVNDAEYTDGNGTPCGLTVLQKCVSVGASAGGHIAGACTAMTKEFVAFILPEDYAEMPKYHDVYIHRWAKALGCKHITTDVLQTWRIHGSNSSAATQMTTPERVSMLTWRAKFKGADSRSDYLTKALQFRRMCIHLAAKRDEFSRLEVAADYGDVLGELSRHIDAFENRAALHDVSYPGRLAAIADMALRGKYKYFYGWKSIAKDLLI
ncbi:glycosyltransferase [Methylosinus sp. Sm6]|uniref:glycosyltransferase n=1 Tax=Methylosinus sp. Sm6 TaxID=2866948 RepID=UPI001C999498|nr:glycosyltransferase [Methylosinus sp. Sm6]MBY6242471.1 glycosyltransferase [Methylosinus sp. Sm6]